MANYDKYYVGEKSPYSLGGYRGYPEPNYNSYPSYHNAFKMNFEDKTNKEEKHMITHVQVDDLPFAVKVTASNIVDAITQASIKLCGMTGRVNWTLVAVKDVEVTEARATLQVRTVQVADANGNVHVPDAKGVLVPVTASS